MSEQQDDQDEGEILFAPDDEGEDAGGTDGWTVLIVDDEPAIHDVTKIALRNFSYDGRSINFLHAFSASEACEVLKENRSVALIFLDVVMETEDAGFEVIKFVREELRNDLVSIVLRTGQPGSAPERDVIVQYAINDYKAKSELTAQKLFVSVVASLRAYKNLVELEHLNRNLAQEVERQTEVLQQRAMELRDLNNHLEDRVKQKAEQVRQQEQLLIQQSKLAEMGEMIGSIAHQWRQPLNMLGLMVQDLPEAFRFDELTQESLEKLAADCMAQIDHMSETIEDFRRFLAPSKQRTQFNAFAAFDSVLNLVREKFARDEIVIEARGDREVEIYGFESELKQVLINVLNNARDALLERDIVGKRIVVDISRQGGTARISIADNGGGIPEDVLPRIFESYFTTKPESKGTGIGLYMSQAIIEKSMGGKFYAQNVGDGAMFVIEL